MPAAVQYDGVDPGNPGQLPTLADAGTKLLFVDATDSFKVKTRDEFGVDELLGSLGGADWELSAGIVDNGAGLYVPPVNELVMVNPAGLGATLQLPDPAGLGGKRIGIKNVTDVEDPGQPFGSALIISISVAAGNLDGLAQATMTTLREFRVYVSNNVDAWMQMG